MTRALPDRRSAYRDEIDLKYRIYNGIFLGLPFERARTAGILLPVFASRAKQQLEDGVAPEEIVRRFFNDHSDAYEITDHFDLLFNLLQLVERQVVLFDALEDAAFPHIHDTDGLGTLNETLDRIDQAEQRHRFVEIVDRFRVRIVLTAHPTQFYPASVLGIITDLAHAIRTNDLSEIYNVLLQLGKTRFQNRAKPTPVDEAKSLVWYLENVFYPTMPNIHARIVGSARESFSDAADISPLLELGFWPGGDRDGNPFVDAQTTLEVSRILHHSIINLYLGEVARISRRLTFEGAIDRIEIIRQRLYGTLRRQCEDPDLEPYAVAEELRSDLLELVTHLEEQHDGLFQGIVEDFVWKVTVFGFHFATIDIRQDSRVHFRALEGALDRIPSITEIIDSTDPPVSREEFTKRNAADAVLCDTVESIHAGREIQGALGNRSIHRYIISNTSSSEDILNVLALARIAGYERNSVDLDIVPLFETVEDLKHAPQVMTNLFETAVYANHLRYRNNEQHIMLGFSDGTKDGGYVTANWMIFKAREELTRVAEGYGVRVIFFEGRGGPPARGGGKTHQFYRGMSRRSAREQIHLTIQGQTISSNFGTTDSARYNLEQLVTALIENVVFEDEHHDLRDSDRQIVESLSSNSLLHYQDLKNRDDFVSYLETMTPLRLYGAANNASRPTSRGSGGPLRFEDLRAIPFVGSWSQMKQNVPGYYGFGTALLKEIDAGNLSRLQDLFKDHLFFRTLVENSMQSLSKINFDLTRHISDSSAYGEIWRKLETEAIQTKNALLKVTDSRELLQHDHSTRLSISLRESIVLPALVIQQYALALLRENPPQEEKEPIAKMVIKSMAIIVNAGRNSV